MADELNQLLKLASGFADMRKQPDEEKYADLKRRLAEEELEMAQAMKPFHMATMENEASLAKIRTDTARWDASRRQAVDAFGKWQALAATGNKQQADQLAIQFYNEQVLDGVQAAPGEKGGFILTDAKGNQTAWNPTDEEIGQAWAGYISDDPVKFYQSRKTEELDRFNANYNAAFNRKVFMDDSGNLAWWTDGVDIKTGQAKGMAVDGDGRQYAAPQDLEKKGFRFLGSIDELAQDPTRLEKYLNARDGLEARQLEQKLFRMKPLIEAEKDLQKKAAMVENYKQGLAKLEFFEQRSGQSGVLTPKELAAVESQIRQAWNTMDDVQSAQYESYEQFADTMRQSLASQYTAAKKQSLMSGILSLGGAGGQAAGGGQPGDPPAGGEDSPDFWKKFLVPAKGDKNKGSAMLPSHGKPGEKKKKKDPDLAEIAGQRFRSVYAQ